MNENLKTVHTIVLDTGPVIKNIPPVSSLLSQAECLVTTPSVVQEIKDPVTRHRVQTTLLPFLTLRIPKPESAVAVSQFARKTGDYTVLSRVDIEILALAYELECERNGGDWRLRNTPGQKNLNGTPPGRLIEVNKGTHIESKVESEPIIAPETTSEYISTEQQTTRINLGSDLALEEALANITVSEEARPEETQIPRIEGEKFDQSEEAQEDSEKREEEETSEDSDSDGWITPSNIKKQKSLEEADSVTQTEPSTLQVATLTTDFAMQNVLLLMNLNLLSTSLQRIKHLKTFVLRCHACFNVTKDMNKQFCSRCGKPTLTKVTCSTNSKGEFKLHLKKNMQWNTRGDRYSIPKAVSGSANGKLNVGGGGKGGGKGGWGQNLILAEDQKEYIRACAHEKRQKQMDLMDMDYLPSILTGDRNRAGGRPKIGAGRNVNSKKR